MTIKDGKIYRACLYEGSKREKDKNFFTEMEAIAYCLNNIKDTNKVVELTINFDDAKCGLCVKKSKGLFFNNAMGVNYYDKGKYTNKKCTFEILLLPNGNDRPKPYIDNVEGGKAIKIKLDTDFNRKEFEGLEIDGTKYLLISVTRKTHFDYVAIPYVDGVFQSEGVLKFKFMGGEK